MSKLNVDQKTIMLLFSDKKSDFLIPDYQRPYAWEESQCQTLWDDIFAFAFPDNNYEKFEKNRIKNDKCITSRSAFRLKNHYKFKLSLINFQFGICLFR